MCGLNVPELLEAAHIIPDEHDGADDPRNGLVLCCNHHRAYDSNLFLIDPKSLKLHYIKPGSSGSYLRIIRTDLLHLSRKPHPEALQWRWDHLPEKIRGEAAG